MREQRTENREQKGTAFPVLCSLFAVRNHAQRGFTLLLAALVSSIVLALGTAIFTIAQKQVTLSAIGRDSQFAFYAADTAAECALYWDFRCNYFATSTASINPACAIPAEGPLCGAQSMSPEGRPSEGSPNPYPYTMQSGLMDLFTDVVPGDYCAQVTVEKSLDAETSAVKTIVHADGYNVPCAAIGTNARTLQRSVELQY